MLEFKRLEYADIEYLRAVFERDNLERAEAGIPLICDNLFGTTFLWRGYYDTKWARCGDSVVLLASCEGTEMFSFPIGGDPRTALAAIGEYAHGRGMNMYFCFVAEQNVPMFGEVFDVVFPSEEPDWSDYVYDRTEISELSGREFHGQKNFVNRFGKMHPDAEIIPMTATNAAMMADFVAKWDELYSDGSKMAAAELSAICDLAEHWDELGLSGAILTAGGETAGFTVGEIVGDTVFVHFEKAMQDMPGAYQYLSTGYLRSLDAPDVKFVNREEDMGIPGLRQSKSSLHPVKMLKKYTVFCC